MRSMRPVMILAAALLAGPAALAQDPARNPQDQADAGRQAWVAACNAQADRLGLAEARRNTFMLTCVAGEKLDTAAAQKAAAQAK